MLSICQRHFLISKDRQSFAGNAIVFSLTLKDHIVGHEQLCTVSCLQCRCNSNYQSFLFVSPAEHSQQSGIDIPGRRIEAKRVHN